MTVLLLQDRARIAFDAAADLVEAAMDEAEGYYEDDRAWGEDSGLAVASNLLDRLFCNGPLPHGDTERLERARAIWARARELGCDPEL